MEKTRKCSHTKSTGHYNQESQPQHFFFFFFLMIRRPPRSPLFPNTTLSRSQAINDDAGTTLVFLGSLDADLRKQKIKANIASAKTLGAAFAAKAKAAGITAVVFDRRDRKSTRLNSSHSQISYAVFCLKKKNA